MQKDKTCKDCLHYDLCKSAIMDSAIVRRLMLNGSVMFEEAKEQVMQEYYASCNHFKDRSKFIDLPCNVGDVIYIPQRKRISVHKVVSFYIGFGNTVFMNLTPIEGYLVSYLNVGDIGKKAFLTSEECEQALKRCNNE